MHLLLERLILIEHNYFYLYEDDGKYKKHKIYLIFDNVTNFKDFLLPISGGVNGALIGESLLTANNISSKMKEFLS